MAINTPKAERRELPPELDSLDLMLRSQLKARNAPERLIQKWDDFLQECADWAEGEKKNAGRTE